MSTLSDGVFAIAMTLLVLDLRPPEVGPLSDSWSFAAGLVDQRGFLSWLLSFAILCRLWTVQHPISHSGSIARSNG